MLDLKECMTGLSGPIEVGFKIANEITTLTDQIGVMLPEVEAKQKNDQVVAEGTAGLMPRR